MRTQEELKAYYAGTDLSYSGENPPEGWRFVDPEKEDIAVDHLRSYFNDGNGEPWFFFQDELDIKSGKDCKWVLITDLPLPDFAPENLNKQNKQTENKNMNERKYIIRYNDLNFEVPESTLKSVFAKDSYGWKAVASDYDAVSRFIQDGKLTKENAQIFMSAGRIIDGQYRNFDFPPQYSRVVKFVYRKNRDDISWRKVGVMKETEEYIEGIDLSDDQFKKFLKEKIFGGEIIETT